MKIKSKIVAVALMAISISGISFADTNSGQNGNFQMENKDIKKISKEDFYAKLDLNNEQKAKLDILFSEFENTMKKNQPTQGNPPEKGQMEKVVSTLNTKVKAILTDRQYVTYQTYINSYLLPPGPPPGGKPNN